MMQLTFKLLIIIWPPEVSPFCWRGICVYSLKGGHQHFLSYRMCCSRISARARPHALNRSKICLKENRFFTSYVVNLQEYANIIETKKVANIPQNIGSAIVFREGLYLFSYFVSSSEMANVDAMRKNHLQSLNL